MTWRRGWAVVDGNVVQTDIWIEQGLVRGVGESTHTRPELVDHHGKPLKTRGRIVGFKK